MSRKKIQLCINADDFGFSPEISRGILHMIEEGLVSSTSIMASHCSGDEWKKISEKENISVGLHFSLTSGCNHFAANCKNQYVLARKIVSGKIKSRNILDELFVQYEIVRKNYSEEITHIDTHQHIHILPVVARAIKNFSAEKKIPYFRIAREISPGISVKKILFNLFGKKSAIPVFGLNMMGKTFTAKNILRHFEFLKEKNIGKAIWIVHPGYKSDKIKFSDSYNEEREREIKSLLETRNKIFDFAEIVPLNELV
ncbi:MAG: ChbG/HpnK family deacetylase [Bacteroidetes bacterium]|nr:ChbG/HpnK family deacetylase [Bacteroidota bacterium]